jgi:hypothetical protein
MTTDAQPFKIPYSLIETLRCPVAIKQAGADAAVLRLYKDSWLISDTSGCKYPIIDGIPVMLPEVGRQYIETPEDQLEVPPPRELVKA